MFDFAFAKGWTTRDNPASTRVFKHLVKGKRAPKKPHASLAWEKVPAFVERLRASDAVTARIVEFSILTGVRSQEARGAQWSEIDFDRKVWTVPPERMKRRLPHEVPLSTAALALIERMQIERTFRRGGNDGFIFPGGRGEAQSDDKAARRQATWAVVKRIEPDATPHGFRSSFAIWGEHQSVEPHLIERCLAHDERKATQRAYRGIERDQLTEKRRPIMEAWGAFVAGASRQRAAIREAGGMKEDLVCAHCGEEFTPPDDEQWNDAKALAELEQKFPGTPVEECVVICDDCYQKMMRQ